MNKEKKVEESENKTGNMEKIEKNKEKESNEDKEKEEKIKEKEKEDRKKKKEEDKIKSWGAKTELGKLVRKGKIESLDEILGKRKILEPEIVDFLIKPEEDLLKIGQARGKYGGGKRRVFRQTQKKTAEGNVMKFACMAVIGDKNGHVGIGMGKAQETLPARDKAKRKAKLNVIRVERGCGSFDCSCNEKHSIPIQVEGKCGSSKIVLMPAPQGTGLAVNDACKRILELAGIKDVYSKTFGQTRTTFNLAKACLDALNKTKKVK
jgi:small subunit ribosomal protein S5